jgi:hypothetical protein
MNFVNISMDIETAKNNLHNSGDYGLLWIPATEK